jgi:hypothetical protein
MPGGRKPVKEEEYIARQSFIQAGYPLFTCKVFFQEHFAGKHFYF